MNSRLEKLILVVIAVTNIINGRPVPNRNALINSESLDHLDSSFALVKIWWTVRR